MKSYKNSNLLKSKMMQKYQLNLPPRLISIFLSVTVDTLPISYNI